MRQLLQNLRTGEFSLVDCPVPNRPEGFVLVANRASLISAGTERSTVQAAQASLLGKARQRPDKVQQVLDNLKKEGLLATIARVRDKLDQPTTLGYSSAGVVLDADEHGALRVGDRVACGGANYAVHADVVLVPRNLVVPLPELVDFEQGSFATVGAIALQGVRRAGVQLGDRVLVIGLGLLGQITWQLVRHAGGVPIGTDVSAGAVDLARSLGLGHALVRGRDDVEGTCAELTAGHGVDAVIVTASAKSADPVLLGGAACREAGRLVIVGMVPLDIPREPFYRKELDVVISRSYGPGRYDPAYEEGGQDYPYGFVRWTEQRNMAAVLDAIAAGGLRVDSLITHRFPFERATDAYDIVSGKVDEPHVGIVLQYPEEVGLQSTVAIARGGAVSPAPAGQMPGVAFIGAGSFARGSLLPHVKSRTDIRRVAVATARGYTAVDAARKFGFGEASSDGEALIADSRVDIVFIATRHDHHASLVSRALAAGKHVFVEKPLAVDEQQLARLAEVARGAGRIVQTGFNRRFSPLARELRGVLASSAAPVQVTYRVNAGPLPAGHWLLDPREGGGRIIGEGCHFVDLIQFLTGDLPARVTASGFGGDAEGATSVLLEMAGGSVGVLVYQANASNRVAKERVEAFAGGRGGIIDDWRRLELFEGRSSRTVKPGGQAKGFAEEVDAFFAAVRSGQPAIGIESQLLTTAATFAILRSITERRPIEVRVPEVVPASDVGPVDSPR